MIIFRFKTNLKDSFFLNRNKLPIFGKLKFDQTDRSFEVCIFVHFMMKIYVNILK